MKTLLVILIMVPVVCLAQSKKDHEHAMGRFVKFYNNNKADSITKMFSKDWGDKYILWSKQTNEDTKRKYGKIISYKYLGESKEDSVTVFIVRFSKLDTKAMSFNLDKENKFLTFRLDTSSDEIKEMMKTAK